MSTSSESSFISDIKMAAHSHLHHDADAQAVKLVPESEPATSLAEQLRAIDLNDPSSALKIINTVLATIRHQADSHSLTTQEVDLAMVQVAELAKKASKISRKEGKEADAAEEDLTVFDQVRAFFKGSNDRIQLARRERKQADRADRTAEKSKQTGSKLDEAVDQLILNEVAEAEPEFAKLLELQDKLSDLIDAGESVVSEANDLSSAATTDALINVNTGNSGADAALEMLQNSSVSSENAELGEALQKFNQLLTKYKDWATKLDWSPNFLLQFNNSIDVAWNLIGNESLVTMGHMFDLIGGLSAASEADSISTAAQDLVDKLQAELSSTEKAITTVIEAIRSDLKLG